MKKDLLKEIVLKKDTYDISIYRLLEKETLDLIIKKLDNKSVVSNVDPNNITSSEEQFIALLDRYMSFFKSHIYNLGKHYNYCVNNLINDNKELFIPYLTSKHYLGDNKYIRFFEDNNNRLTISNFIKNCLYLDNLKQFMLDNGFKIKPIERYSFNEVMKISKLLSNMTYCYNDSFHLIVLFEDVKDIIQNSKVPEDHKQAMYDHYSMKYNIIIDEYNNKKKYIEMLQK